MGLACGGGSHSRGGLSWAKLPGVSFAQEKPRVWLWPPDVPWLWRGAGEVPNLSEENLCASTVVSLAKVIVSEALLLPARTHAQAGALQFRKVVLWVNQFIWSSLCISTYISL